MVNRGYQHDDQRIVDYGLWRLPGTGLDLRGPARLELPSRYVVALGAAQTFGRFCAEPYPQLLERDLQLPVINFGFSGAGPSYFLEQPQLLQVITGATAVVLQVMSGRSVSNSVFTTSVNQGLVRKRSGGDPRFAEHAYRDLLRTSSPETLCALRAETRRVYLAQMRTLIQGISPPVLLLYFSARTPEYAEGVESLSAYWGDFPHFIDRPTVDELAAYADAYVEAASSDGIPQPLFDRETREPVELWKQEQFPDVKLRCHNMYYPSPEMHAHAALKLREPLRAILEKPKAPKVSKPCLRRIIINHHIFKNAGSTVDVALERTFGKRWRAIDHRDIAAFLTDRDIHEFLEQNQDLVAVSCHQLRPPVTARLGQLMFPIVLIRHPIDRLGSIYEFERTRANESTAPHTRKANELAFPEFVDWCLEEAEARRPISNFQTLVLSQDQTLRGRGWADEPDVTSLSDALDYLNSIPVVGVVDEYAKSAAAFGNWLTPTFPTLDLRQDPINVSRPEVLELTMEQRLERVRTELGARRYMKVVEANALDLELYRVAKLRLAASMTAFE